MSKTNVVILYHRSLFAAGIESRLRQVNGLNIVSVDADTAVSLNQIINIDPDVIIVDRHDGATTNCASISDILNQYKAARVISLDLNSAEISIYRRESRLVATTTDLLAAIQDQSVDDGMR